MKYKAFVAATVKDLGDQRTRVVDQLRKCGIDVDPMRDWPADPSNPAGLSAERTKGCHFCVALVGFQRGTIAHADPAGRSITQLEIDAAVKHGARVLVFMLADTPANRALWEARGYPVERDPDNAERLHPRLVDWRSSLQTQLTCEFFQADEAVAGTSPQVLPAVLRQILKWEQRRRLRLVSVLASVLFLLVVPLAVFLSSQGFRQRLLSRFLAYHDPVAFNHSRDGEYHAVRLIDGSAEMHDNTNFREELAATRKSWKVFANTFQSIQEYERDFDDLAARGVEVKVVLTDFSEGNRRIWEPFLLAMGVAEPGNAERWASANTYLTLSRLKAKYPEQVDFRLSRQPMLYGMWLRDGETAEALGHWRLNYYGNKNVSDWPCFRVTTLSGPGQIVALREQFNVVWQRAVEYSPPK